MFGPNGATVSAMGYRVCNGSPLLGSHVFAHLTLRSSKVDPPGDLLWAGSIFNERFWELQRDLLFMRFQELRPDILLTNPLLMR